MAMRPFVKLLCAFSNCVVSYNEDDDWHARNDQGEGDNALTRGRTDHDST